MKYEGNSWKSSTSDDQPNREYSFDLIRHDLCKIILILDHDTDIHVVRYVPATRPATTA